MKSKLNLKDLTVKSFVTGLDSKNADTAKGGMFSQGTPCLNTMYEEFCNWTKPPYCCPNTAPH